jgi:hypothetical protein
VVIFSAGLFYKPIKDCTPICLSREIISRVERAGIEYFYEVVAKILAINKHEWIPKAVPKKDWRPSVDETDNYVSAGAL